MIDSKHCNLYLKRLQCFLDLINNPEKQIPHYIHITGTSGKGSVALILSSILKSSGKKTGTLTSPSPDTLQSRIEINGIKISKTDFTKIVEKHVKPALEKYKKVFPHNLPSFYEIITAIALKYFADEELKWVVLEVGCGGKYDSTNIIPKKDLAIITNIGLDHMEILGSTKAKIAKEKLGIVKKRDVLFTTEEDEKILSVMKKYCEKEKAKIKILNTKFKKINKNTFEYKNKKYTLPVLGIHQIKNTILAIESANYLKIPSKYTLQGLKNVKLPMRFEIISKEPLTILDSAHNEDKIKSTVEAVNSLSKKGDLHLLISFSKGKDIKRMVEILSSLNPKTTTITKYKKNNLKQPENPRLVAREFKKLLPHTQIKTFSNSQKALNWTKLQLTSKDTILITGSTYLAGEIKTA